MSSSTKICFNAHCKAPKSDPTAGWRKGWRLRSGDLAELCDRCSTSYEQGGFCEAFHSHGDGWRKCETCGKRVHCGCIVSASAFVLLDAGGIECMACAQKGFVVSNKLFQKPYERGTGQMWSSSVFLPTSEKLKESPVKSWNQISANNAASGQWRQPSTAWSAAIAAQSDLHQRLSFEFDRHNSIERLMSGGRSTVLDKRKMEDLHDRPISSGLNRITIDGLVNGNTGLKASGFSGFRRDEGGTERLQESGAHVEDTHRVLTRKGVIHGSRLSSSAGIKIEKVPNTCIGAPIRPPILKDEPTSAVIGLSSPFSAPVESNDQARVSASQAHSQTPPSSSSKQLYPNPNNGMESTGESQNQIRNGRPRMDGRGRNQLLPRYWPRITDQELQQISGDSNSVITPLFEKILSASDAGRIGRLVLPKKCAEAYFPAISQPEGLPLKVQDATGKEWVFQFRFWPNNNSRMYVLEGVTPCIQSMQLQAGDTVTFSQIDPEGKLVMGFRKASNIQCEQVPKSGNGLSCTSEDKMDWSKLDKSEFIQKERAPTKSSLLPGRRKSTTVGSKSKRLRIENEESIELKLTWEEAQELLRPPPSCLPSIVVIEGYEFEEYEEAPVLGRPSIFTSNKEGGKDQWSQCEDCSKWRKLPADALLPSRWTCSDNAWDPDRSSCSLPQEISTEELADMLPLNSSSTKKSKAKVENDTLEGSDGLDTLANLAILGEGESPPHPSQPTTRHPRHRPGCTCIVCIQPPSGKGPKHKQTCGCNVCLTVKRRFRTLMLRKEKRQSEKEAETARKKTQQGPSPDLPAQESEKLAISKKTKEAITDGVADEESDKRKELLSPVKTEIDLNMQPEREEEPSPPITNNSVIMPIQNTPS